MNLKHYSFLLLVLLLASCANRGIGPQGGPKDETPPEALQSVPENGSVYFKGDKLEVTFNEYLQLDNVSQHLLMSPPQQTPPDVKVRGKKLIVLFKDTLRDSTTYTLDFGAAVCDYTEKNPARGYTFAFSTGPIIDTMEIRGKVYDAMTLNPQKNIFVGIHSNMDDSAFTTLPFDRVGRTDSTGAFRIGNMHPGTYRLYGVDEISRDYLLTPGEALAYADETVTPEVRPHYHTDSLGNDSLIGYEYGPADLVLWLFKPEQQRLYLQRTLREKQHTIQLLFSAEPDSLPSFRALRPSEIDSTLSDSAWIDPMNYVFTQYSTHRDTITLWLTDSLAIAQDSIFLETRYRRTDSVYNLEWYTDTLRAIWRAPRMSAKAKEALDKKNRMRSLEIKSNARSGFELNDTLRVRCTTPLATIECDSIHLFEKVDTVLKPVCFTLAPYDSVPMMLTFIAPLKQGKHYELHVDSAALRDVYGVVNKAITFKMTLKTPEDYSTLRVKLIPFEPQARIQVLNVKDEVVRDLPAEPNGALFEYLKPDTYYLRMFIDANGDGKWTTGSWDEKRQPETVYYFKEAIQTKSNWDFEEEWDFLAVPQLEAKPADLIKAAPQKK